MMMWDINERKQGANIIRCKMVNAQLLNRTGEIDTAIVA